MVLFICLDSDNGISFNHRRQSADRCVYEKILTIVGKNTLWVQPYSIKKFPEVRISVIDRFTQIPDSDAYCFAEDDTVLSMIENFDKIIVYRWNRHYPSDVVFPQAYLDMYRLTDTATFPGNSHEIITEEQYTK